MHALAVGTCCVPVAFTLGVLVRVRKPVALGVALERREGVVEAEGQRDTEAAAVPRSLRVAEPVPQPVLGLGSAERAALVEEIAGGVPEGETEAEPERLAEAVPLPAALPVA